MPLCGTIGHKLGHLSDPMFKLKRLPLFLNNKFSSQFFDLIHCNIWGPYGQSPYDGKSYIFFFDYCG